MTRLELEWDLAVWFLTHETGIKELLKDSYLLPDINCDIFLDHYSDNILTLIRREVQNTFPINPEELQSIITKPWVSDLLGLDIFLPPPY